jgi:hypothetical protein
MRTSDTINELATALAKAQGEIANPKKDGVNPHFKNRYATLAQVRDTVTPALSANGIALVQLTGPGEPGQMVLYTRLVHASGQWMEGAYPVFMDTAKPQIMGAAMTYARRYTICAICNIMQDDDDGEAAEDAGKQNGNGFPAGNPDIKYPKYPADAKPTPGVVKARDNNDFYAMLQREIDDEKTKDGLRAWRRMRERDLEERVSPDAMLHLSERYENAMAVLP